MTTNNDGTLRGDLTTIDVARTVYTQNAIQTQFQKTGNGDIGGIVPFDQAPADQRDVLIEGVKAVVLDPKITPARLHELWTNAMTTRGWTRGSQTMTEKKQHALLVPYDELSPSNQLRAVQLIGLVRSLMPQADPVNERQAVGAGIVRDGY